MVKSPPCCVSLQKATKIISIIQLVLTSLALLVLTVSFVVVSLNYSATTIPSTLTLPSNTLSIFRLQNFSSVEFKTDEQGVISKNNLTIVYDGKTFYSEKYVVSEEVNKYMAIIVICVFFCTLILILDAQLLKGAFDRNYWRCMVCFQTRAIQYIIQLVLTPLVLIVMTPEIHWGLWIAIVAQVGIIFYINWIIYAFIKELELELEVNGNMGGQSVPFIVKT